MPATAGQPAASASASASIDAYLAKAQPFAQPILHHLRETVHQAVPDVTEAIKWSRPFFLHHDVILANMASFKQHCSFGLWGTEMAGMLRADGLDTSQGMGTFGRLTSLDDLPPPAQLAHYIRRAADLIAGGVRTHSIQRVAKPRPSSTEEVSPALLQALGTDQAAAANFARMSPSCRREYNEWIAAAKRDDTRARRISEALSMIAAGKSRNWKYERTAREG